MHPQPGLPPFEGVPLESCVPLYLRGGGGEALSSSVLPVEAAAAAGSWCEQGDHKNQYFEEQQIHNH